MVKKWTCQRNVIVEAKFHDYDAITICKIQNSFILPSDEVIAEVIAKEN